MLIGLNGALKSGKDTTYSIIKELRPDAEKISFAEPLKRSAAAALGLDVETLEDLKGREDLLYELVTPNHIDVYSFNIRQYLQWYGTEAHRDIFGTDFWVDQALPLGLDHSNRILVVTDMRFENEIQRVKDLGGICVKIARKVETAHGGHASEKPMDHLMDLFVNNYGSMDNLRHEVASLLGEVERREGLAPGIAGSLRVKEIV